MQALVQAVLNHQVVAFPCDTIWGLMGLMEADVIQKIGALKHRPEHNPLVVLVPSFSWVSQLAAPLTQWQQAFLGTVWPGPTTVVLPKHPQVSSLLTGGRSTIALRLPKFKLLNTFLDQVGGPLVSTSINVSGTPFATCLDEVPPEILTQIGVPDFDAVPGLGVPSAVVDATQNPPQLLRKGGG